MLIVFRTEIKIANQSTFAYTANEVDDNGNPINYLSGAQLAELIGESQKSTIHNRMSKELKAALGNDFTTIQGKTKTSQNNYIKVSLWDTLSCTQYIGYHATKGNQRAISLLIALSVTSLDIIINDAFNRDYKKGQAEELANARFNGKIVRRTLTDAINDYIKTHSELSDNYRNFIYKNISDAVNKAIFNRRAKQLREDWKVDNPRDAMNQAELQLVSEVENLTTRLIDKDQLEPMAAVKEAISRLCLPTIKR